MTNYSHLSYEDRKNIEDGLNQNKSINQIAKELNRSHSTLLREVDRNRKYSEPTSWNNYKINNPDLDLSCERLNHSSYVCNGCKKRVNVLYLKDFIMFYMQMMKLEIV